jgi:molybdenum cofactor cytidylyltransferase
MVHFILLIVYCFMITGILLAAGRSTRMGQPKLLLPWGNIQLVRHVAQTALHSSLDDLIVVTGHRAEHVHAALDGLPVTLVHNAAFLDGQSTSVRAGIAALGDDAQAAMILLADQPLLQPSTIDALIGTYHQHQSPIVAPRYNGQRGNPVLFDRTLFAELSMVQGDQGARLVLQAHTQHLQLVDVADEGVLLDLDTPENYQKLWCRIQT